jgi:hypothetical protein
MRQPTETRQQDALARMRDVLQEDFLELAMHEYRLQESLSGAPSCHFHGLLTAPGQGQEWPVEAHGVGLVDACFGALIERFREGHPSLGSLRFTSFAVRGLMQDPEQGHTSDAEAEADIGITNAWGQELRFCTRSTSVTGASVEAVVQAIEYFINSERAFLRIQAALEHYRRDNRADLVAKYTAMLADMVRNTSYTHLMSGR